MFVSFISAMLIVLAVYIFCGAIFSVIFHIRALGRIDPAVAGAGWVFRVLITPGIIALWPLLALKWRRAATVGYPFGDNAAPVSPERIRRIHWAAMQLLAILL